MKRISILICNRNYEEFLSAAIDSALSQTYPSKEVIVVDDGSTDGSRSVITAFGDRVSAIFKEKGGQGSAFNAAFAAACGEVIIFLDADDVLLPETAARVVELFERRPTTVKAHYRLQIIDELGRPTGSFTPPVSVVLGEGDLRPAVLSSPDDVPHPPTSGNAFSAAALRRVLPMPEAQYSWLADVYLVNLVSLMGPVARMEGIGGHYRVHGRNVHYTSELDLERVRMGIRTTAATHRHLAALAWSLGLVETRGLRLASVTDLALRLISLRVEPHAHPIQSDRKLSLAASGLITAFRRSNLAFRRRLLYAGWFAVAAVVPRRILLLLAKRLLAAWRSGSMQRTRLA